MSRMICAGLAFFVAGQLAAMGAIANAEEDKRKPIPTPQEQETALATIRPLFQKDFMAARTAQQQMAVSKKIVETARATQGDLIGQYTLYRVARDICARCNEVDALLEIVGEVDEAFADDGGKFRLDGLVGLIRGATAAGKKQQLVKLFEECVEQAVVSEQFALAREAIGHAQSLAHAANDNELSRRLADRAAALDKQQELVKIAKAAIEKGDANDAAALLAAAKYLTFLKRDYQRGFDLLASVSDEKLAAQAKAEIAKPRQPRDLFTLADGWWDLAAEHPEVASGMKARAGELYLSALPGLSGLAKTKAEQRLGSVPKSVAAKPQNNWIVVFKADNPKLWDTDSEGPLGFAKSLKDLPADIKYLRISIPGKGPVTSAIIEITTERLTRKTLSRNVGWQGTKEDFYGGTHLGIYHLQLPSNGPGGASMERKESSEDYSGWGFSHVWGKNAQGTAWAGKLLPTIPVFEIAISPGPLSKSEEKLLVK